MGGPDKFVATDNGYHGSAVPASLPSIVATLAMTGPPPTGQSNPSNESAFTQAPANPGATRITATSTVRPREGLPVLARCEDLRRLQISWKQRRGKPLRPPPIAPNEITAIKIMIYYQLSFFKVNINRLF